MYLNMSIIICITHQLSNLIHLGPELNRGSLNFWTVSLAQNMDS